MKKTFLFLCLTAVVCGTLVFGCNSKSGKRDFLNVSYDPTRELYDDYNKMFAQHWLETTGETIDVEKSNGGSGAQARAVVSGQPADVVTLALASDVDVVAAAGLFSPGAEDPESDAYWQKRLPNNSCPYTSTIVILVREGNPKNIKDWDDLARDDVKVVTPNPKTSGGARWNYLALWGYALDKALAEDGGLDAFKSGELPQEKIDAAQDAAFEFTKKVFTNAFQQGMQSGARGATDDFVKNGLGDAFLAWENEAILAKEFAKDGAFEIVVPEISIKAEPPVAVVDTVVDRRKTRDIAEEYLKFMYEPQAQELIAKRHYRPYDEEVLAKYRDKFPETKLFTVDEIFGGWKRAQKEHFDDEGIFDKMLLEFAKTVK
ncbi:MAG: sulfate ABC transporter substrate-binding protein [Thermoguttaceae bacterium]|nr:sulfate ABC transporter substrate-binding protein [Thermoguttaceae bacterium]